MRWNRIGRPLLRCNKTRKKLEREISETFIECWRSTECVNTTPIAHTFFSCTVVVQSSCHCLQALTSRITSGSRITEHVVSVLLPNSYTSPSTGTPSSHVQHPPLSEHKPCGDPRPHLSGALAEPRPCTGSEPKQLAENQDHSHFTRDKQVTEHEDLRVKPVFPPTDHSVDLRFCRKHTAPGAGLRRWATSCSAGFTTVLTGARNKCRTIASLSLWTRKLDVHLKIR